MDLPKNTFKAALKRGERQLGLWVSSGSPDITEILGTCGYDWLVIDLEHTTQSLGGAVGQLRALAPYPVSPVVRPGWNDAVEIKRLLDGGAQTLIVPYVQNADEARAAVAAVRYPPRGIRGVAGATRASRYGTVKDYATRAEEEICLIVQVETAEALSHIEEIAAVDGVDGIFVGPSDLAASLGFPGKPSEPEVKAAVVDAIRRITEAGKPAGILALDDGLLREAAEAGAVFIALGLDTILLRQAANARLAEWR